MAGVADSPRRVRPVGDLPLAFFKMDPVVAGVSPAVSKMRSRHDCRHNSRKANVLPRIHLEVQVQRIFRVRLDHFLHEFHENGVFAKDCVLVHRLKIDGNEERPRQFGVDPLPTFNVQDLGNFQQLHARIHHHRLHASRGDLGFEFIENDMMNHEGKANRRFR